MKKSLFKIALLTAVSAVSVMGSAQAGEFENGIWDKDRFQIRGRIIGVLADGDGNVDTTTLSTDVDHAYVPEVDLTYFFTKNVAAELIAATAEHSIYANTTKVGDTWILPPTLTLQYHFQPEEKFSPYIGAGINYSLFYGEDAKGSNGFSNLEVDGGFGWALQAGADYWINDNWGVNIDAKYIDLDVDVHANGGTVNASNVDLNPWVVGLGVSYRF